MPEKGDEISFALAAEASDASRQAAVQERWSAWFLRELANELAHDFQSLDQPQLGEYVQRTADAVYFWFREKYAQGSPQDFWLQLASLRLYLAAGDVKVTPQPQIIVVIDVLTGMVTTED